jgi:D-alanyl-D-alanine carboxypeptidase (penicillin-binding protein 5/6)
VRRSPNLVRRPSSPGLLGIISNVIDYLGSMRGSWRILLLVGMMIVALATTVMPGATEPDPSGGASDPKLAHGGMAAPGGPYASAPTLTPLPSPTPCCVKPPAIPTALPVSHLGNAPVRKPGTPDPEPSTQHVVVVDGESGAILFHRNGFEPIAPASLTKIMTAILGIEHGNPSEKVKVDVSAKDFEDSTLMGLEPWFDVTLEDLLYGAMLPSGNDAAVAIARYVAGSEDLFVGLMNEKARQLGLKSTHFANPHGLDEANHYSSPYDMATLARYGMQYPLFRELAAATSYDISRSNIAYTIENLNPLLWAYPGADGVKIGYTEDAGRAIVASATQDGHQIFVAFMRSEAGLVPDATVLFDWAFNSFDWQVSSP